MAVKMFLLLFALSIFFVTASSSPVSSVELPGPLYRFKRPILLENPAEVLNDLINGTISPESIQEFINSVLPSAISNLQSRVNNEDLLDTFLRSSIESRALIQGRSVEDVESIVDVLNSVLGGNVLVITNDSITIDIDELGDVVLNIATALIAEEYSDNLILQIVLTATVTQQIEVCKVELASIVAEVAIPLDVVNEAVSFLTGFSRAKRDVGIVGDIIIFLVRQKLKVILTPIQENIDGELEGLTEVLLRFYTAEQPSGVLASFVTNITNNIVIRLSSVVVTVQYNVDALFNNLIYGNVSSSSRKRRDVDYLEFEDFYNLRRVDLEATHNRIARSIDPISALTTIFRIVLSPLTTPLNTLVKNIFVALLSAQYNNIGKIVTTPIRFIVNEVLNAILPCTVCISIV